MSTPVADRAERSARTTAKFEARRAELARSAIVALADSGYANTSLRDIAQNSDFSHGVLHYYFNDKLDLIIYCVRQYKAECVRRYDLVLSRSTTADQLRKGFLRLLGETLVEDAPFHRLWYDLRSQSLFEAALRKDASDIDDALEEMIWRIVSRYAELGDRQPAVRPSVAYAVFDGLFQRALLAHLSGDRRAATVLRKEAATALDMALSPA